MTVYTASIPLSKKKVSTVIGAELIHVPWNEVSHCNRCNIIIRIWHVVLFDKNITIIYYSVVLTSKVSTRLCTKLSKVMLQVCPTTTHIMEMARIPSTHSSESGVDLNVKKRRVFVYTEKLTNSGLMRDGAAGHKANVNFINMFYALNFGIIF